MHSRLCSGSSITYERIPKLKDQGNKLDQTGKGDHLTGKKYRAAELAEKTHLGDGDHEPRLNLTRRGARRERESLRPSAGRPPRSLA
jgi:hypothetical protein